MRRRGRVEDDEGLLVEEGGWMGKREAYLAPEGDHLVNHPPDGEQCAKHAEGALSQAGSDKCWQWGRCRDSQRD